MAGVCSGEGKTGHLTRANSFPIQSRSHCPATKAVRRHLYFWTEKTNRVFPLLWALNAQKSRMGVGHHGELSRPRTDFFKVFESWSQLFLNTYLAV